MHLKKPQIQKKRSYLLIVSDEANKVETSLNTGEVALYGIGYVHHSGHEFEASLLLFIIYSLIMRLIAFW